MGGPVALDSITNGNRVSCDIQVLHAQVHALIPPKVATENFGFDMGVKAPQPMYIGLFSTI